MSASEIESMRKALAASATAGKTEETKTILQQLRTDVKATEELLKTTKIGLAVGKLRSNDNKEISSLAKELVKKWRDDIGARSGATAPAAAKGVDKSASPATVPAKPSPAPTPAPPASSTSTSTSASASAPSKPPLATNGSSSSVNHAMSPPLLAPSVVRTTKTDNVDTKITDDKTRNKCIELVYDSLALDSAADSSLILQRSTDLESATHRNISDVSAYRAKMRSIYLNLKDKNNPDLRAAVVSGAIDGKLLWSMSVQDLASAEKKKELAALTKEALFSAQGAAPKKSETDMFECGKCKKRRTTYYQMQTRSADEPMTTFVTCLECGHAWRFS